MTIWRQNYRKVKRKYIRANYTFWYFDVKLFSSWKSWLKWNDSVPKLAGVTRVEQYREKRQQLMTCYSLVPNIRISAQFTPFDNTNYNLGITCSSCDEKLEIYFCSGIGKSFIRGHMCSNRYFTHMIRCEEWKSDCSLYITYSLLLSNIWYRNPT